MDNPLYSLRTRISLVVLVVFAALFGVAAEGLLSRRRADLEAARERLQATAEVIAARRDEAVSLVRQIVDSAAQSPQVARLDRPGDCSATLAALPWQAAHLVHLAVARPNGDVACSATPMRHVINIGDRPCFERSLRTDGIVVGGPIKSRLNGEFVLPFCKAVRDTQGSAEGAVLAALDLQWVDRELVREKYPPGSRVGLIAPDGTVLARYPDPEGWLGRSAADTEFFRVLEASGNARTLEARGFDGVERVFAVARFADTDGGPIMLWVGEPKDAVTASAQGQFTRSLATLLGLLALAFAAIATGGERVFMRPILALRDAARRLGEGDLSARSGVPHARHELGQLARSFDEMAAALYSMKQVVRASRALRVLSAGEPAAGSPADEAGLLEGFCREIVQTGGYRMACVLYPREGDGKVARTAAAWHAVHGAECNFAAEALEPAQAAMRGGAPVAIRDARGGAAGEACRSLGERYGFASAVFLPLPLAGVVIGVLGVCAEETDAFGEEETLLLSEAAKRLALAVGERRARAERARLEASLEGSEALFRAAAEASLDALFILESVRGAGGAIADFGIVTVNARAEDMVGASRDRIVGVSMGKLIPPDYREAFIRRLAAVVETGKPLDEELPLDPRAAKPRWFRYQVVPLGQGGLALSARDVTQWRAASMRLRESEERLRLATGFAHQAVWSWDIPADRFTYSDESGPLFGLARGAGFPTAEAFLEVVEPEDRAEVARAFLEFKEHGAPYRREFRVHWPDGTVHWLDGLGAVERDAGGKPARAIGILMDIDARKAGEQALQRALRALRTLSSVNGRLVRATSEAELLKEVCEVLVEEGGYRMAGVAYPQDDAAKSLKHMALAGSGADYVTAAAQTWADTPEGQRPISRAARSGKAELSRDIASDPAFTRFKAAALAHGYACNVALPLSDGTRAFGVLSIYASEPEAFDEQEMKLLQELADDLAFGILGLRTRADRDRKAQALLEHEQKLIASLQNTVTVVAAMVEMRDPYTAGHQKRVADLAVAIGRELGLPPAQLEGMHLAGIVHDLGKIQVPAEILSKPSKLGQYEFELLKAHPETGYELLKGIEFPWPIAEIVREHHERLDGSGYPRGLKGDAILAEARIMAVADVVEAMASHRPYRAALGIDAALAEIERGKGTKFDAAAVEACVRLFREGRFGFGGSGAGRQASG